MKKILYVAPLLAVALSFTACDPAEDDKSPAASLTAEAMANEISVTQNPANSNCVTLNTGKAGYVKIVDETGAEVYSGTGGYFEVSPGGSDNQTWTITRVNQDGSSTSTTKQVAIAEYLNVAPEWELLTSMASKRLDMGYLLAC